MIDGIFLFEKARQFTMSITPRISQQKVSKYQQKRMVEADIDTFQHTITNKTIPITSADLI